MPYTSFVLDKGAIAAYDMDLKLSSIEYMSSKGDQSNPGSYPCRIFSNPSERQGLSRTYCIYEQFPNWQVKFRVVSRRQGGKDGGDTW